MKIAIIGSGNVGKALAARAIESGHSVLLTASDPEHACAAADATGAQPADSNATAVRDAEVVILALPAAAACAAVAELGSGLDGKTVVDTTNRVNVKEPSSVLDGASVTETLAGLAPGAHLVKAFNTIFFEVMRTATQEGAPVDVFLAGDGPGAKARVAELAASMGFRPIDAGPAPMARVLEGMGQLNVSLQVINGWPRQVSFKLVGPIGKRAVPNARENSAK